MRIITLTTNFGTQDYYVGAVKGAMLAINPDLQLVDLTHQIPPQDILSGAFVLRHAAGEFPPDTIHLAVVDPGVGSARRPLVLRSGGHLWVGPDNGLFSFALDDPDCQAHEIANPAFFGERLSSTFHGRDVFAPVAAHLSGGFPLGEIGPRVVEPLRLEETSPQYCGDRILGQVIYLDRFGNLVTNISAADLRPWQENLRVHLGGRQVLTRLSRTYADVGPGEPLALIGSADLLEISVNGGDAARILEIGRHHPVIIEQLREDS